MATFDDLRQELLLYNQQVDVVEGRLVPIRAEGERVPYGNEEPLRLECAAFLEAIRQRTPLLADGRSGLAVLRVLDAAQRSLVCGGRRVVLEDCA
jgi:predicted dehydrogenase